MVQKCYAITWNHSLIFGFGLLGRWGWCYMVTSSLVILCSKMSNEHSTMVLRGNKWHWWSPCWQLLLDRLPGGRHWDAVLCTGYLLGMSTGGWESKGAELCRKSQLARQAYKTSANPARSTAAHTDQQRKPWLDPYTPASINLWKDPCSERGTLQLTTGDWLQ